MKNASRPAIFKWRQTAPALILCAVRYSLSLRDVEELLAERGLAADHTTIWRWLQRYGPELERRLRRHLKPTNESWRIDETYIRVKGRWYYPAQFFSARPMSPFSKLQHILRARSSWLVYAHHASTTFRASMVARGLLTRTGSLSTSRS